jgi:LacI family transcriptional regulator
MRDVAKLAGVSIKTVSRVINDEPAVSENLQVKVRTAASQLGYRPNFTASTLRRSSHTTRTIGLLLKNVANPFSASLLRSIEDAARSRDVVVISASVDEDEQRERQLSLAFLSRNVDGLIIVPAASNHSYLAREVDSGTPIVFVDRAPAGIDADTVSSQNVEGARAAVEHLVARGHRSIAFLGDHERVSTAADRLQGYREALALAGIPADPRLVVTDLRCEELAQRAVRTLMLSRSAPTALFTAQGLITIGAVRALRGLDLQHRVAMFGFDDFQLSDLLDPQVAVVEQDVYRLGQTAGMLLFQRQEGSRTGPGEHIRIPTRLIVRASGDIPPT